MLLRRVVCFPPNATFVSYVMFLINHTECIRPRSDWMIPKIMLKGDRHTGCTIESGE